MQQNLFTSKLAEISVYYSPKVKFKDMTKITRSSDIEPVLRAIWSPTIELREEFYILLLNRANRVLGWNRIAQGGISCTAVDVRLIFSIALKCAASSIILSHNHPSGNLKPSQADIDITRKIVKAGQLLDIQVLDHVIMTNESYFSFADEGLI